MTQVHIPNQSFRIDRLKPYLLGTLAQEVLDARLAGSDVIDFSQINPDIHPPRHILDRLVQAILLPQHHRYSSSQGIRRLRESIANYYSYNYNTSLDIDNEVVSVMGTKEGLSHLLQAVLNPADTVIIPTPTYPIHAAAIYLAGASYVGIPLLPQLDRDCYVLSERSDWFFENLISAYQSMFPRPRLMILSFPHNPTTATVELSFFERMVAIAKEYNLYLVHDFAYSSLSYDGYRAPSIMQVPGAKEIAIEFFSLSKGFGLAGWRVGFAVGNAKLVAALKKIKSYIDFGIFQPIQIAAAELLESPGSFLNDITVSFTKRRDLLVTGLRDLGWELHVPRATVFVWACPPKKWKNLTSVEVCRELLQKYHVAACPGIGFGEDADRFVRFCLVESEERIKTAIERMS